MLQTELESQSLKFLNKSASLGSDPDPHCTVLWSCNYTGKNQRKLLKDCIVLTVRVAVYVLLEKNRIFYRKLTVLHSTVHVHSIIGKLLILKII